jgi:acyl-coenzyme A thioesterase PaaI-like protein
LGIWQDRLDIIADGTATLPSVNRKLGLGRLKCWRKGFVEKEWIVDPSFCVAEGTSEQALFGGYIGALADHILAFTTMTVLDDNHYFRTAELKISFFKKIRDGVVTITGTVVNQSRTLIYADALFSLEGGELAARASAVQVIVPFRAETPRPDTERVKL